MNAQLAKIEPRAPASGLAVLRLPFEPHQVGKLPKPTARRDVMDKLPKAYCDVCHGYHATSKVMHLDYVGHAALTDRLLDADPLWTWEPVAFDESGMPARDANGGMWIKLTVCGHTRLGYGHTDKPGGDGIKELIGDALRNAAMRFGAALDLWHKGELHKAELQEPAEPDDEPEEQPQWLVDWTAKIQDASTLDELQAIGAEMTVANDAQKRRLRPIYYARKKELEGAA